MIEVGETVRASICVGAVIGLFVGLIVATISELGSRR